MKWLLWREYRRNRLLLGIGAVLFLLPYLFLLIWASWVTLKGRDSFDTGMFAGATIFSFLLSPLSIVLLAGNAIAGERADRSAEFITYLPVSRARRLLSKVSLAILFTALIWGPNLLIFAVYGFVILLGDVSIEQFVLVTSAIMYGVAWGISSVQSSPAYAVMGGITAPVLIFLGLLYAETAFKVSWVGKHFGATYSSICAPIGVAGFAFGAWYYLHRVEP